MPNVTPDSHDTKVVGAFEGTMGPALVLDRALTEDERADLMSGRVTLEEFADRHGIELRRNLKPARLIEAGDLVDAPEPGKFATIPLDFSGWPEKLAERWHWVTVAFDGSTLSARVDGKPARLERDGDVWRLRPQLQVARPSIPSNGRQQRRARRTRKQEPQDPKK